MYSNRSVSAATAARAQATRRLPCRSSIRCSGVHSRQCNRHPAMPSRPSTAAACTTTASHHGSRSQPCGWCSCKQESHDLQQTPKLPSAPHCWETMLNLASMVRTCQTSQCFYQYSVLRPATACFLFSSLPARSSVFSACARPFSSLPAFRFF